MTSLHDIERSAAAEADLSENHVWACLCAVLQESSLHAQSQTVSVAMSDSFPLVVLLVRFNEIFTLTQFHEKP